MIMLRVFLFVSYYKCWGGMGVGLNCLMGLNVGGYLILVVGVIAVFGFVVGCCLGWLLVIAVVGGLGFVCAVICVVDLVV